MSSISCCDLNSIGFHIVAVIGCFFWFLVLPIAIMFLTGNLVLFLVKKAAKKAVKLLVYLDAKQLDKKIQRDLKGLED